MPAPSLIATTDTFNDWFNATNNLISFVSNTSQVIQVGGTANGNVSINGTMTVSNLVVNTSANLVGLLVNTTAASVPVPTTIAGNVVISAADLSVGRNLSVTSNTAVGKDLSVGGNASVTGNVAVSGAVYVGSNVTVGLASITIGNTTANTVRTATSFVVANSTNSATLTSTSLTIGTQVLNTTGLSVNSATVTGPLTANGVVGDSGQVLTSNGNGLYWSTLDPGANNTGGTGSIQYYNGTKFGSSANLIFTGTAITVGDTTSNGSYGQGSVTVANTTGSASLSPLSLTVGTQVVNTTGMYVGSNVTLSTTTIFVGNSTANAVQSATNFRVANTTNTATLTPIGLTIGTTVVNTSATVLGGTLSVTGAANALGTLGVTGATNALGTLGVTGAVNALSTLGVSGAVNALSTLGVNGNTTITGLLSVTEASETITINTSALTGTLTFNVLTSGVMYFSASASGNWTVNAIGNSTVTMNTLLAVGKSATLTVIATQGATPRYPTAFAIDGTTTTVNWLSGIAPSAGNANAKDVYTYTIIKTAATPSYLVLGTMSSFS